MSKGAQRLCRRLQLLVTYAAEPPRTDIWQPPAVTIKRRKGDCEDYAILLLYWCLKAGIKCKMFIAYSTFKIGHAIVIADDGTWYANNGEYARVPRKDVIVHLARRMGWKVRPFLFEVTEKMLRGRGISLK